MANEKKCFACGEWTVWTKKQDDRCVHCRALLSSATIASKAVPIPSVVAKRPSFLTQRDDDGLMLRNIRKTAFVAHLIYAGIMWLFMMLFAALVH